MFTAKEAKELADKTRTRMDSIDVITTYIGKAARQGRCFLAPSDFKKNERHYELFMSLFASENDQLTDELIRAGFAFHWRTYEIWWGSHE